MIDSQSRIDDVAPGSRSTVNESPHPARLGRGRHHETNRHTGDFQEGVTSAATQAA